MSLPGLLERGIRAVLAEPATAEELAALCARQGMDGDSGEHLRQTLEAMPRLLAAMDGAMAAPRAPEHARRLFQTVVSYLMDDENLIPSRAGKPLYGLLDDVYLVHVAALELEDHLGRVDLRSVAGGAQLLESALPRTVIEALRGFVREAARAQP